MIMPIVSIIAYTIFILLIFRGDYPQPLHAPRRPARNYIELAIVVACLLVVPFVQFRFLWFSGWASAYFLLGIALPLATDLVPQHSLSALGFRLPINKRVLVYVSALVLLYLISAAFKPLILGIQYNFGLKTIVSNVIIFPLIEEIIFRGIIQTRLESLLGTVQSWVISGLFFGFYHYYHYYLVPGKAPDTAHILALISVTVLGMLFGLIFAKTRSLLPSFVVHCVNNLFTGTPW